MPNVWVKYQNRDPEPVPIDGLEIAAFLKPRIVEELRLDMAPSLLTLHDKDETTHHRGDKPVRELLQGNSFTNYILAKDVPAVPAAATGSLSFRDFLCCIPPSIPPSARKPCMSTSGRSNPRTPTEVSSWVTFKDDLTAYISTLDGECEVPTFTTLQEPCTREEDVMVWCRNNLFEQIDKYTRRAGYGRFGPTNEHEGLDQKATFADRVFWYISDQQATSTLIVEIKPPWKFGGVDIAEVYGRATGRHTLEDSTAEENAVVGAVRQLVGYLSFAKLKYGLLLTYDWCWAVKRGKDQPGHVMFSPAISRVGSSPHLFEAIAYAVSCSGYDPSCPPIPPSRPSSADISTVEDQSSSSEDNYEEMPRSNKRPHPSPSQPRNTRSRKGDSAENMDHCSLEVGNVIGRGSLGLVCEAKLDGIPVILKMVDKRKDPVGGEMLTEEYKQYRKLSDLQGVAVPQLRGFGNLWDIFLFLIMEPTGKPLPCPLGDEVKKKAQSCVQQLHDHNYVHRDLALRNFLMREDGTVVLVDLEKARMATKVEVEGEWRSCCRMLNAM